MVQSLPLRTGYRVASAASRVLETFQRDKKDRLERGISFLAMGGRCAALVSKTFENYAMNSIEVFYYPRMTRSFIEGLIEYEGLDNLNEALEKGKGAVLMHGHFGNEELLMPAFGLLGFQVNQMASKRERPRLKGIGGLFPNFVRGYAYKNRIGYRERFPVNFIYLDSSLRDIYKRLRKNELLLLAIDGREGTKWIDVDFMGKRALFSAGPMRVAIKSGAPVLPVFIIRGKDLRHRLVVGKEFKLTLTGNTAEDILVNTRNFVSILEKYAAQYPEQYLKLFWIDNHFFKDLKL